MKERCGQQQGDDKRKNAGFTFLVHVFASSILMILPSEGDARQEMSKYCGLGRVPPSEDILQYERMRRLYTEGIINILKNPCSFGQP